MHKPRGRYDYCTDVTSVIRGIKDVTITMFPDFECEIDVSCELKNNMIEASCLDVLVDGLSLRHGNELAREVRWNVMEAVDAELEACGPIWDKVREAEGLTMIGQPGDPDARWVRS